MPQDSDEHLNGEEFQPTAGDPALLAQIEAHIRAHIGEPAGVLHEIVSDKIHLDVFVVAPNETRDFYTLVTCGMSQLPMTVPEGAEDRRYAELMLCLPPDWNMNQSAWSDERHYWPIRWLKMLARLPQEHHTWLSYLHTIPNGDPPQPFADNTGLCCAMIFVPLMAPKAFHTLTLQDKTIYCYGVIMLYASEMELKLYEGGDAMLEYLKDTGISELLEIDRPNWLE